MLVYFAIPVALAALVTAGGGIAALTRGWVLPRVRPVIERPRVYGWGVLLLALGMCLLAVSMMVFTDMMLTAGRTIAVAIMFVGSQVVLKSRRPRVADPQVLSGS
ncbi:hypothetical protein ACICHK_34710 [Streptomyces sp. AHU1]|uniref:hypothetical protein n=1 Tax=Streptomyces sp. AHU1 TaxID=3377215 RepID=UPI003877D3C5